MIALGGAIGTGKLAYIEMVSVTTDKSRIVCRLGCRPAYWRSCWRLARLYHHGNHGLLNDGRTW
jgi:hypothetical protein